MKAQPDPDWPALQARYEARDESVADIAASCALSIGALMKQAKARSWAMRSQRRSSVAGISKQAQPLLKPITSTKEAINRLKELVQSRIAKLEQNLAGGGENERAINAANLLARTLEKVLELEEQQRKQSRLTLHDGKRRDDAWRHELADRIARLAGGQHVGTSVELGGSARAVAGLAFMGA